MTETNQEVLIADCIKALNHQGVVLFPTDTIIGLGCDASDNESVKKIIKLKSRTNHKGFIVLVASVKDIDRYVLEKPFIINQLIKETEKPLSIIYPKGKNVSNYVLGNDGSIAIRVVKSGFAHDLISKYGKAIVSTSVNISGKKAALSIREVPELILSGVDYVVNLPEVKNKKQIASTIIKINAKGKPEIIRD